MSDLNVRAVILGALVDIVGTLIASYVFYGIVSAVAGVSLDGAGPYVDLSLGLQVTQLAIGLALTAAGAYVAATLSRGAERTNAFAVGVVSAVISFLLVFTAPPDTTSPFWSIAAGLILTIPAAFTGGELRRWVLTQGGPQP